MTDMLKNLSPYQDLRPTLAYVEDKDKLRPLNVYDLDNLTLYGPPSASGPKVGNGTVFDVHVGERGVIWNLGVNVIYVKMGPNASPTDFHYLLKGGVTQEDALGGSMRNITDPGEYSVFGANGSTPRYLAYTQEIL